MTLETLLFNEVWLPVMGGQVRAVPSHCVLATLWPGPLDDQADGVLEAAGRVRCVGRKHEHFSFVNRNVLKLAIDNDLEKHTALNLVEELFRGLNGAIDKGGNTEVSSATKLHSSRALQLEDDVVCPRKQ